MLSMFSLYGFFSLLLCFYFIDIIWRVIDNNFLFLISDWSPVIIVKVAISLYGMTYSSFNYFILKFRSLKGNRSGRFKNGDAGVPEFLTPEYKSHFIWLYIMPSINKEKHIENSDLKSSSS